MRLSMIGLILFVLQLHLLCYYSNASQPTLQEKLFQDYILKFNKTYDLKSKEYKTRFKNFLNTLSRLSAKNKLMKSLNHVDSDAQYGLNNFSDLSSEEFREKYLTSIKSQSHHYHSSSPLTSESSFNTNIPKKLDWRKKGIVTAVKNQQTSRAKIVRSSDYPFHDATGKCRNNSGEFGVGISQYFCESCNGKCPSVEMTQMVPRMVSYGTLAVTVDALSWQDYVGGIIQHHCSYDSPNHAVQLVGYDMTGDSPFWIVRNSWGSAFGDNGYLYIKMGENLCGVANTYAGVTKVFD